MKTDCIYLPKVKNAAGESVPSILYKDLKDNINLKENRPILNFVYAQYFLDGGTAMDAAGYTAKDVNGQHLADDVYAFYEVSEIINEQADPSKLIEAAMSNDLKAIDSSRNTIYYDNAVKIIKNIVKFNNENKVFIASMQKVGDFYIINVENRNALTQWKQYEAEDIMDSIQKVSEAFNRVGYDLEKLAVKFPKLFSMTNLSSTIGYLMSLTSTKINYMSQNELAFLLNLLDSNSTEYSRIISKYGTLEEAAKKLYEDINGLSSKPLTSGEKSLLVNSIRIAQNFNKLKFTDLISDISAIEDHTIFNRKKSYDIENIIKDIKKEVGLSDKNTIIIDREITKLSQAAENAIILLDNKLKAIEKKYGVTSESEELEKLQDAILKNMDSKRYYQALLMVLKEANDTFKNIETSLENVQGPKGSKEYLKNLAAISVENKKLVQAYINILEKLSNADELVIDTLITIDDVENLKQEAIPILKHARSLQKSFKINQEKIIIDVIADWLGWGNELPDGRTVASLKNLLTDDTGFLEHIYSVSRSSNPLAAAIGSLTREAQDNRNIIMQHYNYRISEATKKLRKAGIRDTKWMYDEYGYIISEYDWKAFYEDIHESKKELMKHNVTGLEYKIALRDAINQVTEEIVVDAKTGRTIKVPIFKVSDENNPLLKLNKAQLEYYKEIMQIKNELESMLPEYAICHYLPPQVRSNSLWDSKGWKDFFKRFGDKFVDPFRITEDDTELAGKLTFADTIGEDYITKDEADYDDTLRKEIPIYHTRKLKDQSKLITDFSGALQRLAYSAINYKCMNDIEAVVLTMADFLKQQGENERSSDNSVKASIVESAENTYAKQIGDLAKQTNTSKVIESYLDREYYGMPLTKKTNPRLAKLVKTLLGYNRFKQLATNITGGTSNFLVGEYQMFLEAVGSDNFNLKDLLWADALLMGDKIVKAPGKFMDYITNNTSELCVLVGNYFDPLQENFTEQGHKRYNSIIRNMFSLDYSGMTYGIGENLIHYTVMYAMLNHEKVYLNGKKVPLYKIFEKTNKKGNAELKIKNGVNLIERDGYGNEVPGRELTDLNDEYLLDFRRKIRHVNQECHGAMNSEDRGVFSRMLLGRMLGQFRQWMVEHYSRRYRGLHWDGSAKQFTEGWYKTLARFLGNNSESISKWSWKSRLTRAELINIIKEYEKESDLRAKSTNGTGKLSERGFKSLEQKAKLARKRLKNLRIASAELIISTLLLGLNIGLMIKRNDDDDELEIETPAGRFFYYQYVRLSWDINAATPFGAIQEIQSVVNKPMAALDRISGALYPITGLAEINEEYESGIHEGENKYKVKLLRTLPLYKDIENWDKILDEDHKYWEDMLQPFEIGRGAVR